MVSTLKISVNPTVALLYSECKTECSFNAKSDSDFLLFLLSSAIRISTLVKDFSPILQTSSLTSLTSSVSECEKSEAKSSSKAEKELLQERIDEQGEEKTPTEDSRKLSSEYEDVLEQIEQTSDLETLQKYIDTVEDSLNHNKTDCTTDSDKQIELLTTNSDDQNNSKDVVTDSGTSNPTENGSSPNCNSCGVVFDTQEQCTEHIKSGTCFNNKNTEIGVSIDTELLKNDIPPKISCSLCNSLFDNQGGLSRHIRSGTCLKNKTLTELKSKEDTLMDYTTKKRSLDALISEQIQSLNKYHKSDLDTSDLRDYVDKAIMSVNSDKQFVCSNCGYSFSTKAALAQHERSLRCEANKLRGMIDTSNTQTSFICHLCNSSLASRSGLQKHLKRGQCRLYRCSSCDQTYKYIHDLKDHLKQHHGGESPMSTTTINQSLLRMGMPSMTGSSHVSLGYSADQSFKFSPKTVTAISCGVCEYQAACQKSLNNHTRIHIRQLKAINADTKCMLCSFFSEDEKELMDHYKTVHADFVSSKSETPEYKLVELMLRHLKRNSLKKTIYNDDHTSNGSNTDNDKQKSAPLLPNNSLSSNSPAVIKTKSLNDNSLKIISAQLKSIDLLQKRLDELDKETAKNSDSDSEIKIKTESDVSQEIKSDDPGTN